MESLTWNKTDTDAVYAYMQEQERPAYMDTVRKRCAVFKVSDAGIGVFY